MQKTHTTKFNSYSHKNFQENRNGKSHPPPDEGHGVVVELLSLSNKPTGAWGSARRGTRRPQVWRGRRAGSLVPARVPVSSSETASPSSRYFSPSYRPQAPPNTRTGPSHWWPVLPPQGSGSPPCETCPSSQSPQQLSSAGFRVSSPPAPGSLRPKGPWSHCPHGHQSLSTWAFRVSAFTAGELLSSTPAFPWEAPSTEGKGPRSQHQAGGAILRSPRMGWAGTFSLLPQVLDSTTGRKKECTE